jgi:flagellar basal-body rod modification protein FlgD
MASAINTVAQTQNPVASSTGSVVDQQTIAGNFQLFLQLLTTQLKNQDPTSPLDTNQFTQQLVQFASVEQQLKTNSSLDALVNINKTAQTTAALNFVGAQVTADGTTTQLKNGVATWNVTSPKPASAVISIIDQAGNTVWTDKQAMDTGLQTYVWNGRTSTGQLAPDGSYKIQITATDAAGGTVLTSTEYTGTVDGVDLTGAEPLLRIGTNYLTIAQVHSLQRPTQTTSPPPTTPALP